LCYKEIVAAPKIKSVRLFIKPYCGWCIQAMQWLDDRNIPYQKLDVIADGAADQEMRQLTGQSMAPVIDVDGHILADFGVEQLAEFWKQFE
jgi:glutaredoxin